MATARREETPARSIRLKDVAPSFSDPREDLVLADLSTPTWQILLASKPKESEALDVLRALLAWDAGGRMRRAYDLPLWPGDEAADPRPLPTTFAVAQQSRADEAEVRDRINHVERWALELVTRNLGLIGRMLQAIEVDDGYGRRALLRQVVALDEVAPQRALRTNELAGSPRRAPAPLSRAESGRDP